MKVLILTSTNSSGDITNDIHHVDSDVNYVQYVDPMINKPEDITQVRWDVAIIDRSLKLADCDATKWLHVLSSYCYRVIQLH